MPVNPMIGASGGNTGFFDSSSIGLRQDLGNYSPETQNTITSEERKRRIANMLLQRGMQPRQGQMTGRFFTPPSKWEQGSDLAQAALGVYMNYKANENEKDAVAKEAIDVGNIRKRVSDALVLRTQGQEPTLAQPEQSMLDTKAGAEDAEPVVTPATAGSPAVPSQLAPASDVLQEVSKAWSMPGADSPVATRFIERHEAALRARENQEETRAFTAAQNALHREDIKLQREINAIHMSRTDGERERHNKEAEKTQAEMARIREDLGKLQAAASMSNAYVNAAAKRDTAKLTVIVDPDSPTGYSSVNPATGEVIGAAPPPVNKTKGPTSQEKLEGQASLSSVVETLKGYYGNLNEGRGIGNTERSGFSNLAPYVSGSTVGREFGRATGTDNQKLRDEIEKTRPHILMAIMKATGMSARQLDSNAELKLWLSVVGDTRSSYQANLEALNNIDRVYGIGNQGGEGFQVDQDALAEQRARRQRGKK